MDHDPKYTISQIGAATGIEPNTIRTWFQRGHLKFLETDKRAEGNGLAHYLSMQSALYIAAVGALVAQGVSPKVAGEAAVSWVHIGSSDPFGKIAPRDPGELFDDGLTVLCVYSNGQAQVKHSPVIGGSILDLFQAYTGREDTATILILNFLDRRVRDAFARSASTN